MIQSGFDYRGRISVDANNHLVFEGGKDQWNQIWLGSYEKTGAVNAEIEIVNTYKADTMDVDLQKYGTDYQIKLDGAEFELYKGTQNGDSIDWESNPTSSITVNSDGAVELNGLVSGYYKLKEVKAPIGFQLLDSGIYFKVDCVTDSLSIVDETGNIIEDTTNLMWRIAPDGSRQIQIKNNALYALPSAGGPGIYWYTLSGALLMMGAALIVYKQQRKREVLLKK